MNRRTNKKSKEPVKKVKKATILNGEGKFNFPNGDFYEGQYIVVNSKEIYRHGKVFLEFAYVTYFLLK